MPRSPKALDASETFAYRKFRSTVELFITVPDSLAEGLPYMLPDFASKLVKVGLKPRADDDWEWRPYSKITAEKHAGIKLRGSKAVLLVWGYCGEARIEKLAKLLPYAVNVVKISDGEEFEMRRIRSVK